MFSVQAKAVGPHRQGSVVGLRRLWHEPAGSGFVYIKPGTLDDPSQLAPRYEGWTKRKVPWLTIDGLEASFEEQASSRRDRAPIQLRAYASVICQLGARAQDYRRTAMDASA